MKHTHQRQSRRCKAGAGNAADEQASVMQSRQIKQVFDVRVFGVQDKWLLAGRAPCRGQMIMMLTSVSHPFAQAVLWLGVMFRTARQAVFRDCACS